MQLKLSIQMHSHFFRSRSILMSSFIFAMALLLNLTFTLAAGAVSNCPVVDISAYWKLDETTGTSGYADDCGELTAGSCRNSVDCPTQGAEAKIINSQAFDRSANTGLNMPGNSFDWAFDDSFTIEFWFMQPPGNIGGGNNYLENQVIIGRVSSATDMVWWLGIENTLGNAIFVLGDQDWKTDGDLIEVRGPKVDDGYWHHLVGVRDGANARTILYLDGRKVAEQNSGFSTGLNSSTDLQIGWLNLDSFFGFTGTVDEMAVYNRALSPAEVRAHYYLVRDDSPTTAVVPYSSRDYTTMCDDPVLVMPLGDSITTGITSGVEPDSIENYVGYRKFLWERLLAAGFYVDLVGAVMAGDFTDPNFDPDNAGYPGATGADIWELLDTGEPPSFLDSNYPGSPPPLPNPYLANFPADVVLLHIGTNNLTQILNGTGNIPTAVTDVDFILDEIDEFSIDATAIVTRIINRKECVLEPINPNCAQISTFNDDVIDMALQRSDPELGGYTGGYLGHKDKIILTNHESGDATGFDPIDYNFEPVGDMYDDALGGIHPYLSGQEKMAAIWYDALTEILPVWLDDSQLVCRTLPTPDIDGNDMVDGSDLVGFIDTFGSSAGGGNYSPSSDFNNDDLVNQADLQVFARKFGTIF
jgi:hypothetical protein